MEKSLPPPHLRYDHEKIRKRYLYALIFNHGEYCYIGQTVNPSRRANEHRSAWKKKKFTMHVLHSIKGTMQDAEEYEFAWRYVAYRKGFSIYGIPPDVVVNPELRMNSDRLALASRLKWPRTARRGGKLMRFLGWTGAVVLAALAFYFAPHSF